MSDQEEILFDMVYLEEIAADDEQQRLKATQFKTRQLLRTWRSRFPDTEVRATYTTDNQEQLVVDSSSKDQVRVEKTNGNAKIIYDYDNSRSEAKLHITAEPLEGSQAAITITDDPAQQLEALSQLLFDCDRMQSQHHN